MPAHGDSQCRPDEGRNPGAGDEGWPDLLGYAHPPAPGTGADRVVRRLLVFVLCLCALAQAEPERLKVTLDEAVQLALVRNPRIAAALAMVRVREEEAEVVAAPGRPMGAFYALAPPPAIFQSNFNTDYALSPARLEFRQLLMDGGRVLARFEQARTQASRAAQEAVSEEHRVCLEVRLAYLEALAAHSRLKVAQESLESARRHQSLARARFQAGQAPFSTGNGCAATRCRGCPGCLCAPDNAGSRRGSRYPFAPLCA
ncbi:hypothetical protein DYH09_28220 [bacterium CPR1]|nr:hypothetical protein [bacterium CPR1]